MITHEDFMELNTMAIEDLMIFAKDHGLIIEDGAITGYEERR